MKNKKLSKLILAALLIAVISLTFVSCQLYEDFLDLFRPAVNRNDKTVIIIFDMGEYTGGINLPGGTAGYSEDGIKELTLDLTAGEIRLEHALDKLAGQNNINYQKSSDPSFGSFITAVDGVTQEDNFYFSIYSDDYDNTDEWAVYTLAGRDYYPAAYGISSMPVKDGKTYIIVYQSSSWF